MTEENTKPHIKRLMTFFTEAPSKTIERTKTFSESFYLHLTQPVTQVSKLKRFFTLSFAIVKGKTNEKMEKLSFKLQKQQAYDYPPNPSKVSSTGKLEGLFKKESGQIEEKNSSKVEHPKRCITPQSRIENNCNSSLAISQLEDQLIDRNAASFANMTLELSMNTNVLQQMALPSKETNISHRELNFDAISNPILEKPESQENILFEQNNDGVIESEQIIQDEDQNTKEQIGQNKLKSTKNKSQGQTAITEPYRNLDKLARFVMKAAPKRITDKSVETIQRIEDKFIKQLSVEQNPNKDPQDDKIELTEIKKKENEQESDKQKENKLEQSIQLEEDKIDEQGIQTNQTKPQTDLTQNINNAQNTNQHDIDIDNQNNSKKHQQSVVNFISSSGALMKKKTMEMFSQIENKIKLQEGQMISFRTQHQTAVENIKNDSIEQNQNLQITKKNDNQVQEEIQYQAQISDQDEYASQVDHSEDDLKISKKNSDTIEKHNQFNYQDENSNQINDSQLNSRGELYSNDKLHQEITNIEKKSFHQDSSDASQMFEFIPQKPKETTDQNQKSKITIEDNQSIQLTSKLFKQDELRQEYEDINLEIQQLQLKNFIVFIHLEKQQILPKQKNILIKSTFKPNYKKLAEIADDNEALYKAKDLVRKMNQKRKDKEERTKKQYDKIEEYFHNLQYLKESQEEMKNRYELQRKLQIQNRIEDYQKKQKEFAQLQKISHNFVQKLINVGPQQGQLAKEFEDNVVSIKGGYRKVKLRNLGIELPKINENNNNAIFRRYMNEEQVKFKQDEMIKKYEASRQALFKSTD